LSIKLVKKNIKYKKSPEMFNDTNIGNYDKVVLSSTLGGDTFLNPKLFEIIGLKIKNFRENKKISQTELGDTVGLTRSSVANIESGRQKVQIDTLYNIAQTLEVEIQDLLPKLVELNTQFLDINYNNLQEDEIDWLKKVIFKGKTI
jgi:transcriptional regulator with XRE-family HTH domain